MQRVLRFHWIRFWIGFVAALQVLGWLLSSLGQLGTAGYALGLPPVLLIAFFAAGCRTHFPGSAATDPDSDAPRGYFWRQPRFRRWLPRVFLVLAAGSLITGLLYAPNNGDGLGYRTPRVLNWLSTGHWYWIDTIDARLNTRTVAYEWVTAPFLALTASDRLLPLISLVSYLLLPGLLFALWRGLGVAGRVAWWWMWLLPTGYGFALQAGGILTDLFGTVFSVAAVQLALEARQRKDASAARFSVLAAALMIGSKVSSLPLLLPWALALWPVIPLLFRQRGALVVTAALALVSSNVPTALLNLRHCGDWTGLAAETRAQAIIGKGSPVAYLKHNAGLLLSQNLNPPILPAAGSVNRWVEGRLTESWKSWLNASAEDGVRAYKLRELVHEDFAGLGLPITILLGILLLAQARRARYHGNDGGTLNPPFPGWLPAVIWSPWIAFLVYATQSGITSAARLILPYYPLLITGLLGAGALATWVRRRWWPVVTVGAGLSSIVICVLSPMRPWFPVLTLRQRVDPKFLTPGSPGDRLGHAYTVCRERATGFDPFLAHLPAGVKQIGMLAQFQFLEAPLWRPFGGRRVVRPPSPATPAAFRERGLQYVVLRVTDVPLLSGLSFEEWLQAGSAEVLFRGVYCHFPIESDTEWVLVKLR